MSMIMRATLHHGASNTYYGQWNARNLRQHGQIDRSIAHNERAARAKSAVVEGRRRVFPGNRGSARGTFTPAGKRNFGRSFQLYPRPRARPLLDHTRAAPAGGKLAAMIKVDQLILAAVACLVAVHLLGAG